jgi:hypothetical protein
VRIRNRLDPDGPQINGPFDTWIDVTDGGIDLNVASNGGDNYAVQDVIAHPTKPKRVFAFICYQGCWRSDNYGQAGSWSKVSITANADAGKNWGGDIAPDGSYLIMAQSSRNAFLKSTDDGVNWVVTGGTGVEMYNAAISPFDKTRVVGTSHAFGNKKMYESLDSGDNWSDMGEINASVTQSGYISYLHNSDTVIFVPESAGQGCYRGTKSGGSWTWSAIATLADVAHAHGSHQIYRDPITGYFYLPGGDNGGDVGIFQSTDNGVTWTQIYSTNVANAIIGTGTRLHAMYSFPIGSGSTSPQWTYAPQSTATGWAAPSTPSGMVNGAKRFAILSDGFHKAIIAGCWHGGIWMRVE